MVDIVLDKLYILSGPSGSGKTFFLKNLVKDGLNKNCIVSIDEIFLNVFGSPIIDGAFSSIKQHNFKNIIHQVVEMRMSQNMPTFLDGDNLTDDVRKEFVNIANQYGMSVEVLVFENKLDLLEKRKNISSKDLAKQLTKFQNTSIYPFRIIDHKEDYVIKLPLLNTSKIDVLGDVHGLFDELLELVKKVGWFYDQKENCLIHKDKERKLLFLGDVVDRGTQSIQVLKLIKNTQQKGSAILLLGNHEEKLLSAYKRFKEEGLFSFKSMSAALTLSDFLKLPENEREDIYQFLKGAEVRKSLWINKKTGKVSFENKKNIMKFGFCHAPNEFFDELMMPRSLALYGKKYEEVTDVDFLYNENFLKGINEHIVFRGHIPATSQQNFVYSLEERQAFEGYLVLLKLDDYISLLKDNNWNPTIKIFEKSIVRYKTEFNFDNYVLGKKMILNEMNKLVNQGLATDGWRKDPVLGKKVPHEDGFKVYKYSKQVHFKRLWKQYPWLEKARGIVLDPLGNIVVHPFDKLYNFGEYNVGKDVPKDKQVQVIEKVNGYLGCISKHPFREELLLSTTGSIGKDAPFVKMIDDFITPELRGRLLHFFKTKDMTLMFEVVHKNDPHIIEYNESDYGLWLIGAREKQLTSKVLPENHLDDIAKQIGVKRPTWEQKSFGEVLESLQTSQLEGFMIRDALSFEPMMKIKTNYYLVTKFVGRMGPNMVKMMFNHPEKFKFEKVDEEFYPIVDKIISKIDENSFNEMLQKDRVLFVRNIVNETRNEFLGENKKSLKMK